MNTSTIENMTCRVCFDQNEKLEFQVKEMMLGLRERFHYFQCRNCQCLQIKEIPLNLDKYYSKEYYSLTSDPQIYFKGKIRKWLKKKRDFFVFTKRGLVGQLVQKILPNNEAEWFNFRTLNLKKTSAILDVGSGTGTIPYIFFNAGFKNIMGIDPFLAENINYPNGLTIKKMSFFDINKKDWDLIMFNHSFEHVPNPFEYLQKAHSILKNDGICVLRIPTVSSYSWKQYQTDWVQLDAPRHLFLHSIESINQLAAKAGYSVEKINYESTSFQFIGSEQYKLNISLFGDENSYFRGNKKLFTDKQITLFSEYAKKLNAEKSGDAIAVILKKL